MTKNSGGEESANQKQDLVEMALAEDRKLSQGATASEEERWEQIARALWQLLDDIDTAMDQYKPDLHAYEKTVDRLVRERHDHLISDGYGLHLPEDFVAQDTRVYEGNDRPLMSKNASPSARPDA